jgi:FkbM family methyltransferase
VRKLFLSWTALAARILPTRAKSAIYRTGPLADGLRRALNRAAPQGLTEVRVAAGLLEGCPIQIDLQTEKDFWLGTYEPELQWALGELVRPGMTAFDVGANIGYITLMLARGVGQTGHVVAFEALPANVERLEHNLALNDLEARVMVLPKAVAGGEGTVRFHVHASGGMGKVEGSASRWNQRYETEISVPSTSLDAFVYEGGGAIPQLIKLDIEGGETLALPAMGRVLREARPVILLEVHGLESLRSAWDAFSSARYAICRMERGFPRVEAEVDTLGTLLDEKGWKAYLVGLPE